MRGTDAQPVATGERENRQYRRVVGFPSLFYRSLGGGGGIGRGLGEEEKEEEEEERGFCPKLIEDLKSDCGARFFLVLQIAPVAVFAGDKLPANAPCGAIRTLKRPRRPQARLGFFTGYEIGWARRS